MAGIFISHRASSQDIVKDFVGKFLVRTCGVSPWHVFTTFRGTEVPPGSMTYTRVMGSLFDAPIILLWADSAYFASFNCITELGASIGARGEVYSLLSPEMPWDKIPPEFKWMSWRYAHDPDVLKDLKKSIKSSPDIDQQARFKEDHPPFWYSATNDSEARHLRGYQQTWPKLIEHRPIHYPGVRQNAVFGLSVWMLENKRVVPILYSDSDQTSVLNDDRLVLHVREKYSVDEVYALWPESDFGVCAHKGNGGVRRRVHNELIQLGIPLPQTSEPAELRAGENYSSPAWFTAWNDQNPVSEM